METKKEPIEDEYREKNTAEKKKRDTFLDLIHVSLEQLLPVTSDGVTFFVIRLNF